MELPSALPWRPQGLVQPQQHQKRALDQLPDHQARHKQQSSRAPGLEPRGAARALAPLASAGKTRMPAGGGWDAHETTTPAHLTLPCRPCPPWHPCSPWRWHRRARCGGLYSSRPRPTLLTASRVRQERRRRRRRTRRAPARRRGPQAFPGGPGCDTWPLPCCSLVPSAAGRRLQPRGRGSQHGHGVWTQPPVPPAGSRRWASCSSR